MSALTPFGRVGGVTGLGTGGGGAVIGVLATVTSSMAQYQLFAAS
ncbi:hypothetical protein [Dactylosporangium salmoneum]